MEFYGDAEEELPQKIPYKNDRAVRIYSCVDANHAGNFAMRRSHTVIIMFI